MYQSSRYGNSISTHPEIKTVLYFLSTEVREVESIRKSSIGVMGLACSIIRQSIGVMGLACSIVRQAGYRVKDHPYLSAHLVRVKSW